MGKEIVVILKPAAIEYLDSLVINLFENDYFIYKENAINYVDKILQQIYFEIHLFTHFKSPIVLLMYGSYYVKIKGSKRTVWYVFFNKFENKFLVKYISNNHTADAAFINLL